MNFREYRNEAVLDRLIRLLVAEVLIISAYFWLGGTWQIVFYIAGFITLFTAMTGFCALYRVSGIKTCQIKPEPTKTYIKVIFFLLYIIVAIAGSYYSAFFTKKFFLNDYNQMNNYYKQTLFYTGQDKRTESIANYDQLTAQYSAFLLKYSSFQPYAIKSDMNFTTDLKKIAVIINSLKEIVYSGELKQAHTGFEEVRPIFQDILKRNNFSMLAVNLVDFHDAMEKIIDAADKKDADELMLVFPEVDAKLKAVEEIANDSEIQSIRARLNEIIILAEDQQLDLLSKKASELKSAFVKVYLSRG